MNLTTKLEALRRNDLAMRLAAFLLCLSLLLGLISPKLEARAFAFAPPAVAAVAAAFLGACGLKVVVDGMDREGLQDAMYKLLKEFLDTELGGITIEEWLGSVWSLTVTLGKIFLGHSLADKLNAFAQWVAGKYGTVEGVNTVYSEEILRLADGTQIVMGVRVSNSGDANITIPSNATPFKVGTYYKLSNSVQLGIVSNGSKYMFYPGGMSTSGLYDGEVYYLAHVPNSREFIVTACHWSPSYSRYVMVGTSSWNRTLLFPDSIDLSIDRAPSMSYMPELEADQGIALDVGAAATMDETAVLQGVLDDVLAGELAPTMEAVKEGTENPPVEEIPDVESLGLPALGEALTSRFPFSIPWDIAKAIRLLAAPEKAPYFEVDFLEPLADDVGGWQGSTAIVLDFSQYAIIGQLSRWTSTIGFCLALASGTKRLIWTA